MVDNNNTQPPVAVTAVNERPAAGGRHWLAKLLGVVEMLLGGAMILVGCAAGGSTGGGAGVGLAVVTAFLWSVCMIVPGLVLLTNWRHAWWAQLLPCFALLSSIYSIVMAIPG